MGTLISDREAWSFIKGAWNRVNLVDAGMNAAVIGEAEFKRRFPQLPQLPTTEKL
jgi:hypothetical protein